MCVPRQLWHAGFAFISLILNRYMRSLRNLKQSCRFTQGTRMEP